ASQHGKTDRLHLLRSFTLLRRTPPTTTYPYTTLFRSAADLQDAGRGDEHLAHHAGDDEPLPRLPAAALQDGAVAARHLRRDARGDRKSTRLNSSHVKISYAVFCLKKKMQQ